MCFETICGIDKQQNLNFFFVSEVISKEALPHNQSSERKDTMAHKTAEIRFALRLWSLAYNKDQGCYASLHFSILKHNKSYTLQFIIKSLGDLVKLSDFLFL